MGEAGGETRDGDLNMLLVFSDVLEIDLLLCWWPVLSWKRQDSEQ